MEYNDVTVQYIEYHVTVQCCDDKIEYYDFAVQNCDVSLSGISQRSVQYYDDQMQYYDVTVQYFDVIMQYKDGIMQYYGAILPYYDLNTIMI
ncbi:hypothetical protein STEG23_019030 [Scotinomys teguina]